MDKRPDFSFRPSQHGAPCPHEGDETARYATFWEDLLLVAGGVLSLFVGVGFILFLISLLTWALK